MAVHKSNVYLLIHIFFICRECYLTLWNVTAIEYIERIIQVYYNLGLIVVGLATISDNNTALLKCIPEIWEHGNIATSLKQIHHILQINFLFQLWPTVLTKVLCSHKLFLCN